MIKQPVGLHVSLILLVFLVLVVNGRAILCAVRAEYGIFGSGQIFDEGAVSRPDVFLGHLGVLRVLGIVGQVLLVDLHPVLFVFLHLVFFILIHFHTFARTRLRNKEVSCDCNKDLK